ncbi:MAG: helix-turn-helix domain-containing protein [Bacteroidales bacterium]|nr:helix-turn-helix domain-containing protein [Bacteroidales bacterium]
MINRINLLLQAKNITAKQFAEEIGIQPSGMSHILGGRNNPSLEFVSKVLRRYPEIDANWLLLGKGEMYVASSTPFQPQPVRPIPEELEPQVEQTVPSLFDEPEDNEPQIPAQQPEPHVPSEAAIDDIPAPARQITKETVVRDSEEVRALERILFIYSDNTFREVFPC